MIAGAILGGIAGAAVGQGASLMSGVIVGGVEALIVSGLIVSFGKPAFDIVIATLRGDDWLVPSSRSSRGFGSWQRSGRREMVSEPQEVMLAEDLLTGLAVATMAL